MGCKAVVSMSNKNDMPAFPCGRDVTLDQFAPSAGMTLRDYFAAKALIAYFSDGAGFALQHEASKWAYETADAMMDARK